MNEIRLPQRGQRAAAPAPVSAPQAQAAAHSVTYQRFEEENEDRFELPGSDDYAAVTDQGHQVWILELWVHPDRRGHGRAAALLEAVLARYAGRVLALSAEPFTRTDDEPAGLGPAELAAWYARHGFSHCEEHQMTRPPDTTRTCRRPPP